MLRKVAKWCLIQEILLVLVGLLLCKQCSQVSRIMDTVTEQLDGYGLELRRLVSKQEKRLRKIKGLVIELHELSGDELMDPKFTVHHPLNAYRFIRNHSVIYNETATKLIEEIRLYEKERDEIDRIASNIPTVNAKDIEETIHDLLQLQSTYGLHTNDIAEGILPGTAADKMTARECQDVMAAAYQKRKTDVAREWLNAALTRVSNGDSTTSKTKILSKGAAITFMVKDVKVAVRLYKQVVNLHPRSRYHKLKMKYYMKQRTVTENFDTVALTGVENNEIGSKYERLCQGAHEDMRNMRKPSGKLSCAYTDIRHPLLLYRPAKLEVLSLNPYIVIYHDLFSQSFLSNLMKSAKKEHVKTSNLRKGEQHTSDPERSGKGVFVMQTAESEYVFNLIEALTSLKQTSYDYLQLTDVQSGGDTVFPDIGEIVRPEAGKVLFWYNPNRSVHDGAFMVECPVYLGDKWIATVEIQRKRQTFRID
ncbi:prolyl 4-hydroxylase subunit alpha-1-like isoform X2 [Mercenaria mercenaria]|uniref:prolyl 4-hydroxylase subunit alpha-1-like isoform X2 n=1 Tax=Mercenaria mercenaria TaxID=6596 RepID=UPI00234E469A|nr:prolyl 4-hydroxylase subunit alpha-1-like isoform X2 [Mercenaria mercenaria]